VSVKMQIKTYCFCAVQGIFRIINGWCLGVYVFGLITKTPTV